jgi:hypothetical protein
MTKQYGEVLEALLWLAVHTEGRDPVLTADQRTTFWGELTRLAAEGYEEMLAFKHDVIEECLRLKVDVDQWSRPEDWSDDGDLSGRLLQQGPTAVTDRELCKILLNGMIDCVSECAWHDYCADEPLAEIWREALKGRPVPVLCQEKGIGRDFAPTP